MQKKFIKTYILGAVLVVAIIALFFPRFTNHQDKEKKVDNKIFSFETKDIDKIDLEYPDRRNGFDSGVRQIVQLKKIDDNWVDATNHNYKVIKSDVITILEKTVGITQGEVISKNPERQAELEVGKDKGNHVKLWQGDKIIADFWLGKTGVNGGTYFRLDSSDLVYSSKDNIGFYFSKPEWVDKTIIHQEKESLNKIVLNNSKQQIVLEKEATEIKPADGAETKDKWNVTAPSKFEASEEKVNNLLENVSNLMAQDIVFDKNINETGLLDSKFKISTYSNGNVSAEFIIGNKIKAEAGANVDEMMGGPQDQYYVKSVNSDQIFTISSYLVENIFGINVNDYKVVK